MPEQSIVSEDMTLKRLLQDFYRVPDYQREYVWGEVNAEEEGGEEVNQFLEDIRTEFENVTQDAAPEYFIGTIVVCRGQDDVLELIDGQQRTTTCYITICAIRDVLLTLGLLAPDELQSQIASSTIDWRGETVRRYRLELQYEDAGDILVRLAESGDLTRSIHATRSIQNISNAYATVREFLQATFGGDAAAVRKFYGYLTNKVKIIRIETPTIAKALKIFETINDRGVGLDAMDLLKNLLFMHAKESEFSRLKNLWKSLGDEIFRAKEKPLRFLRYYLLSSFNVDGRLREDAIYDWFTRNEKLTSHATDPIGFAERLLGAAKAYANFARGNNHYGSRESGIVNTQLLGGKSIKQHFIIFLAGRHLSESAFARLADEVEKTMFVWLISRTAGKDYERRIIDLAHALRDVKEADFAAFVQKSFVVERASLRQRFMQVLLGLHYNDTRQFRVRYLIAKITQYVDLQAYGPSESRSNLADYTAGGNDIEHILPDHGDEEAIFEFGERGDDQNIIQSIGNLLLIEKAINRSVQNKKYAVKLGAYPQSKFLLTRCQGSREANQVGKADRITQTVQSLESFLVWNAMAVQARQKFLATLALKVWDVP